MRNYNQALIDRANACVDLAEACIDGCCTCSSEKAWMKAGIAILEGLDESLSRTFTGERVIATVTQWIESSEQWLMVHTS